MSDIKLTDKAKGFRDLYWCWSFNEPILVWPLDVCRECKAEGVSKSDRHEFIAHVQKGLERPDGPA
jgi:hypothetical protein